MALVIEDGTGVVGATSYVTLAEARAYATLRGASVPADDPSLEQLLVRGTDYLEAQRRRYNGMKANGPGFLQWPRQNADGSGIVVDGATLAVTAIPVELRSAACQLAIELQAVDPIATMSGPAVKEETVGPIKTVYAVGDNAGQVLPRMPKVEALLEPLLRSGGIVSVIRV